MHEIGFSLFLEADIRMWLGIAAFGPRKKIAKAIIALRERREQVEEERAKQMMELKEREKEVAMKKAAARKRKEDRQRRTYRPFGKATKAERWTLLMLY